MDVKSELEKVEKEINSKCKDYVNARGKAQIANLVDKIEVRAKMPNFKSIVMDGDKPITITMLDFLNGINTTVPAKDKPDLIKLEKRQMALTVLLEALEDVPEKKK